MSGFCWSSMTYRCSKHVSIHWLHWSHLQGVQGLSQQGTFCPAVLQDTSWSCPHAQVMVALHPSLLPSHLSLSADHLKFRRYLQYFFQISILFHWRFLFWSNFFFLPRLLFFQERKLILTAWILIRVQLYATYLTVPLCVATHFRCFPRSRLCHSL